MRHKIYGCNTLFMCIYNIDIKMMPFVKLQFLNYNFSDIGIIRINQSVSTEIKRNNRAKL